MKNKKGFLTVLVLALLPLVSVALLVFASQTRQMVQVTRTMRSDTQLENVLHSGVVWLQVQGKKGLLPPAGTEVRPDLADLRTKNATCIIQITDGPQAPSAVITAQINTPRGILKKSLKIPLDR